MNSETIHSNLFTLVTAAAQFATKSRRLQLSGDKPDCELPAIFQLQGPQYVKRVRGIPPVYTLRVELWIYAQSDDTNTAPISVLNPLVDAVRAALEPAVDGDEQTLGLSYVSHCFIAGDIEIFDAILGNTVLAIIPVEILATD